MILYLTASTLATPYPVNPPALLDAWEAAECPSPARGRGFEQKLMELYQQFQQGECSLGYLAEQLGISSWEAVHLLEERGLRVTNL